MSDFVKSLAQSAAQIDKVASGSLYPHQSDGVAFLLSKRRVILADDKARQTNVTPVISACMRKIPVGIQMVPKQRCWKRGLWLNGLFKS
jgi:hypothetical protein